MTDTNHTSIYHAIYNEKGQTIDGQECNIIEQVDIRKYLKCTIKGRGTLNK